ncbi:MAG TPA: ABC transporter permease [Azospirillaceae bacterium]|nr:ABC transporter permease [Azospirillaceae bacterium]
MFGNYVTVAIRFLARHKLYAAINVIGLAVGLAACALIALFVRHETGYDKFYTDAERIYRVNRTEFIPGRTPATSAITAMPAGPALKDGIPEIEAAVRVARYGTIVRSQDTTFQERVGRVDGDFFRLFDFAFLKGSPEAALSEPNSVVLTQSRARKYFGDEDPVGRSLEMTTGRVWRVTGVIADPPANSMFESYGLFTAMGTSFSDGADAQFRRREPRWDSSWIHTFVLLAPGTDPATVERRMPEVLAVRAPDYLPPEKAEGRVSFSLSLQPLTEIHTNPQDGERGTPIAVILGFIGVGALILLIAGINFVNLTTARATLRAREVAVRKTLGATRGRLMRQFLAESVLLALVSGAVALALVELLSPGFRDLLGIPRLAEGISLWELALAGLPVLALVGLMSGAYPALVLSSFKPATVLKGGRVGGGAGRLRASLVIVQFAIAITLGVCTLVMLAQTRFASTQRLGFDRENLVVIRSLLIDEVRSGRDGLVEEIRRMPGVVSAALTSWVPSDASERTSGYRLPGSAPDQRLTLRTEPVDFGYLETLGARVLAGRTFQEARETDALPDTTQPGARLEAATVVTESMLPVLGVRTPQEAVGRTLLYPSDGPNGQGVEMVLTVVGVVEDIQFSTARNPVVPTVFLIERNALGVLVVRLASGRGPEELAAIDQAWRSRFPSVPLRRDFLDDRIRQLYETEARQGAVLAAFAGLAILIACLGLFGLASFTAERRTKEIGVRKVLGARTRDILRLMLWQFSKPVLAACLIAWPVAWWTMGDWLEGFAYRITLNPLVFLAAGAAALVIAWTTVGVHAVQVARAKPVNALRYE